MNVVIPEILTGGTGRAIQGVGQSIGALSHGVGKMTEGIMEEVRKQEEKEQAQRDYVEAMRRENDMRVEKNNDYTERTRTQDGTNSQYPDDVRKADEQIGQKYIGEATNPRVKDYLTKVHYATQKENILKAHEEQSNRLWQTTEEANKIKADNVLRATVQYGGYDQGLATLGEIFESQRNYYGSLTDEKKKEGLERFTYNFVRTSLSDPQLSVTMLRRLEDQKEKEKIYSHLPADKLAAMETHIKTA